MGGSQSSPVAGVVTKGDEPAAPGRSDPAPLAAIPNSIPSQSQSQSQQSQEEAFRSSLDAMAAQVFESVENRLTSVHDQNLAKAKNMVIAGAF